MKNFASGDRVIVVTTHDQTSAHWNGAIGTVLYSFPDLDGRYWLQMDSAWDDGEPKWFMPTELAILKAAVIAETAIY